MKLSSIFLSLLLVFAVINYGCKSNPTATPPQNGLPQITIIPDSLHGSEFVSYTFKAKISNYDLAQIYFMWDMGDGSQIYRQDLSYEKTYSFSKPGKFTIKVNAYDIYTDSIIASKSENIFIDTTHSSIEIVPQFYNGSVSMDDFGKLIDGIYFSIKPSNPSIPLQYFWDFGDGTKDSTQGANLYHNYLKPGIYTIKVSAYQESGIYQGTDTALVAINFGDVSRGLLGQMGRVQTILYLDSSYQVFHSAGILNPLGVGLQFSNSAGYSSNWNSGNFSTQFHKETGIGTSNYELQDFLISGIVSSDFKSISSIHVSALDTTSSGKLSTIFEYGYKANNAELIASTLDKVIYRIISTDLKNELFDLSFTENQYSNSTYPCPGVDNAYTHLAAFSQPQPQLFIVFSRK